MVLFCFFHLGSIDQLAFPLHEVLHWKRVFIVKPSICTLYIDFFFNINKINNVPVYHNLGSDFWSHSSDCVLIKHWKKSLYFFDGVCPNFLRQHTSSGSDVRIKNSKSCIATSILIMTDFTSQRTQGDFMHTKI